VLHEVGFVIVGVHSPWKKLSGLRFSWMTMMICWKEGIWAEAGAVRQSAANVKGNSRIIHFPHCFFFPVLRYSSAYRSKLPHYNSVVRRDLTRGCPRFMAAATPLHRSLRSTEPDAGGV
jgi:hypothetical protein